jgi:hypothetical protein
VAVTAHQAFFRGLVQLDFDAQQHTVLQLLKLLLWLQHHKDNFSAVL